MGKRRLAGWVAAGLMLAGAGAAGLPLLGQGMLSISGPAAPMGDSPRADGGAGDTACGSGG